MANKKPKVNRLIAGTELIFCTVDELIPLFPSLKKKEIKLLLNFPNYTYKPLIIKNAKKSS